MKRYMGLKYDYFDLRFILGSLGVGQRLINIFACGVVWMRSRVVIVPHLSI